MLSIVGTTSKHLRLQLAYVKEQNTGFHTVQTNLIFWTLVYLLKYKDIGRDNFNSQENTVEFPNRITEC